jgi:hypothetical protein
MYGKAFRGFFVCRTPTFDDDKRDEIVALLNENNIEFIELLKEDEK